MIIDTKIPLTNASIATVLLLPVANLCCFYRVAKSKHVALCRTGTESNERKVDHHSFMTKDRNLVPLPDLFLIALRKY